VCVCHTGLMLELAPQSWEIPFDEPIPAFEAVTEVILNEKPCVLGWGEGYKGMESARVLVFQTQNGPLGRVLDPTCILRRRIIRTDHSLRIASEWAFTIKSSPSSVLQTGFKKACRLNTLARLFYLNEDAQLREHGQVARFAVVLSPLGWGLFRSLSEPREKRLVTRDEVGFWWPTEDATLLEKPAHDLWNGLREQLDSPDSPIGFTRRLMQKSQAERMALLWNWKNGDERELEQVVRWLFLSQTPWWQTPRHLRWHLDLHKKNAFNVAIGGGPNPPRTPELEAALHQVWDWFSPAPNVKALKHHLELKRLFVASEHLTVVDINEPTMHEQMEAALRWREWLERSGA